MYLIERYLYSREDDLVPNVGEVDILLIAIPKYV